MELYQVEEKLRTFFGPTIFDYLFLFGKKEIKPVIDPYNKDQQQLLAQYITAVNLLFKESGQPELTFKNDTELEKNFWETMHNLYIFRQMFAQHLFSKYEMIRIDTWYEEKIIAQAGHSFPQAPTTFAFDIPDTFLIDSLGNFDLNSTRIREQTTNNIKSYLSTIPFARQTKESLYSLFWDNTSKELISRFFNKEILDLCEIILTEIGLFLTRSIYSNISKGYSLKEAKNNVLNLIYKQFQSKNYYSALESFQKSLLNKIIEELSKIKALERDTCETIAAEFWSIFVLYFDRTIFFPANYYALMFRLADHERSTEKTFNHIIDSTLIEDDGSLWDIPIETYAIDLTQSSRKKIFNILTNGFENPIYTFNDYLFIYS